MHKPAAQVNPVQAVHHAAASMDFAAQLVFFALKFCESSPNNIKGPRYCLGGCNPLFSNAFDSCAPNAACKTQVYTFTDKSRILADSSTFDGNPDTHDWIVDGGNFDIVDNNLVMMSLILFSICTVS